jgi:hypothetical protein
MAIMDWIPGPYSDVEVDEIVLDEDLQPRCGIDADLVAEYREALAGGAVFPPIVAFREGVQLWCADGHHRVLAHRALGKAKIPAVVSDGDRIAALKHSLTANATHGRPRTRADMARGYAVAKKAGLVEAGDVAGVVKVLVCSPAWAYRLTEEDRGTARIARDQSILTMHAEGKTQKQIGQVLGVSAKTVVRVVSGQNSTVEICPPDPLAGRVNGARLSAEQLKVLRSGECPFDQWPPLRTDGTRVSKAELFGLFCSLSEEELSLMGALLLDASDVAHTRAHDLAEELRQELDAHWEDLDPVIRSEARFFVDHLDEVYEEIGAESADTDWVVIDAEEAKRATLRVMAARGVSHEWMQSLPPAEV